MNVWAKFNLKFDENLSKFACFCFTINLNFKPFVAFFKPYEKIKKVEQTLPHRKQICKNLCDN